MRSILTALVLCVAALSASAQSIVSFEQRDRHPGSGAIAIAPRIPVTIASPGLPGPGEIMQVVWRTAVEREYGLSNPSAQPIHWQGYVYSGFHLYLTETATIPLTPETAIGGFALWSRTLQGGETYWGPAAPGPYIEGGARKVHEWHLHPWLEGWRFDAPEVTLWLEPVVYGAITQGGHASGVSHLGRHDVTMLRLRNVPQ